MKKSVARLALLGAAIGGLTLPLATAGPAAAGPGWDKVGSTKLVAPHAKPNYYKSEQTGPSAGGSFKVCFSPTGGESYTMYEADSGNADDKVGNFQVGKDGCIVADNISKFVDGSNNRAELYVTTKSLKTRKVVYYD